MNLTTFHTTVSRRREHDDHATRAQSVIRRTQMLLKEAALSLERGNNYSANALIQLSHDLLGDITTTELP